MFNDILITLDTDWAPDYAIDHAAEMLATRGVRSTWFVTHSSPAIDRLRQRPDLFQLGIHPNFLPGSTHGASVEDAVRFCLELVPEATAVRPHSLAQAGPWLMHMIDTGRFKTDVSLFLPYCDALRPVPFHWRGKTLLRLPYYWEDDYELAQARPFQAMHRALTRSHDGLKIFNFHPIHTYLNSANFEAYEAVKRSNPDLTKVSRDIADAHAHDGEGTVSIFRRIIDVLSGSDSLRISDLYDRWVGAAE